MSSSTVNNTIFMDGAAEYMTAKWAAASGIRQIWDKYPAK